MSYDVLCEVCGVNKTGESDREGLRRGMCASCAASWQPPPEQQNEQRIREAAAAALDTLDTIIATPPTTVAQCSQAIVRLARIQKGVIRLVIRRFDAAD